MIWWARTRRLTLLAQWLGALLAADAAFGTIEISIPSVGAGMRALSLRLVVPLGLVILTRWALSTADSHESRSVRRVGLADGSVAVALVVAHLVETLVVRSGNGLDSLAGVRGTAGLVGLALLERLFIGVRAATIVPTAYVLVAAMFGGQAGGSAAWWAWPAAPRVTVSSLCVAAVLFVAGEVALVVS